MKILIVPTWFPQPDNPWHGIFIGEQARALATRHEVTVLAAEVAPAGTELSRTEESSGACRVIRVNLPARNLVHHFDYARVVAKEIRAGDYDLVHAHVTLPAGFAAVLAGMWTRRPVVITEHKGPFSSLMQTPRDRLKARFALRRADAVITVSRWLEAKVREYGIRRPIHVIPNLIDPKVFAPSLRPHRNGGPYRLLYAGFLREEKNVPMLFQALGMLARRGGERYRLRVVGDGPMREQYERMAKELGVTHLCEFAGGGLPEKIAREMAACDLLVLTSRYETFAVVVAEAMAVGRPVVATRCGGPEELVTPQTGRLVPVDDHAALADAISQVCQNLDAYRPEEISAYAHGRFSHAVVVDQLTRIYESVTRAKVTAARKVG